MTLQKGCYHKSSERLVHVRCGQRQAPIVNQPVSRLEKVKDFIIFPLRCSLRMHQNGISRILSYGICHISPSFRTWPFMKELIMRAVFAYILKPFPLGVPCWCPSWEMFHPSVRPKLLSFVDVPSKLCNGSCSPVWRQDIPPVTRVICT